jgi:hypothetical protein
LLPAPAAGATLTSVRGFAGKLYVGGYFSLLSGGQKGVARRNTDGTWTGIGAATDFNVAYPVKLSVVNDAAGPGLYIGGLSWMPDGVGGASISGAVLRYDGVSVTSPLQAFAAFSNGGAGSGRGVVGEAMEFDRGDGPAVYLSGRFSAYSDATTAPLPLTAPARSIVRVPQSGELAGHVLELGSGVNMQLDPNTAVSWVPNMLKVNFDGRDQLAFFGHVWGGGGQPSYGYVLFDGEHWTINPQRVTTPSNTPPFLAGVSAQVNGVERLLLAPNLGSQLGYVTPGSTTLTPYGPAGVFLSGARQLQFFDDGTTGGPVLYIQSTAQIQRLVDGAWRSLALANFASMLIGDLGDGPRLYAGLSSTSGPYGLGVWNGTTFEFLGTQGELPRSPTTLVIHDDGNGPRLYASFEGEGNAAGQPLRRIAKLEGSHWVPLGEGLSGGMSILGLASFDDGSGPALYAAGDFTQAGNLPSKGFARWRRGSWEPVLDINPRFTGFHRNDLSLAVLGDTLYLSGMFSDTGLRPAGAPTNISTNVIVGENLVALRRCPPACFPDMNQDGNVDAGDIDYLINVAAGGANPSGVRTDLNNDGATDMGDVDVLINVVAGAPCQ